MKQTSDGRIFYIDHGIIILPIINLLILYLIATKSTQWEDPRLLASNKPAHVRNY